MVAGRTPVSPTGGSVLVMRAAEATEILRALRHFATSLADAEHELNAINVFPIADGDTGTNLRRTIDAMVVELDGADGDAELPAAVAIAALNAARGNSGLICAQYLAGLVSVDPSALFVDGASLARSLAVAAARARAAVARPVEGTMVSVADVAARAAADRVGAGVGDAITSVPSGAPVVAGPSSQLLADVHEVVQRAVADTRQQLPVLTRAGVVDAGAAGLSLLFDALAEVARGRCDQPPSAEHGPDVGGATVSAAASPTNPGDTSGTGGGSSPAVGAQGPAVLGYELQFTADGDEGVADRLRGVLADVGDSVVVSHGHGIIRAHVHLTAIGPAIEAVIDVVRPRNIDVEPLIEVAAS